MRLLALATVLGSLCSCGEDTEEYRFEDQAGQQCVRTCSGGACTFSCDAPPLPSATCSADEHPCFTLSYFGPDLELGLCDSCCDADSSFYFEIDCSQLVCAEQRDCAVGDAVCVEGLCYRE